MLQISQVTSPRLTVLAASPRVRVPMEMKPNRASSITTFEPYCPKELRRRTVREELAKLRRSQANDRAEQERREDNDRRAKRVLEAGLAKALDQAERLRDLTDSHRRNVGFDDEVSVLPSAGVRGGNGNEIDYYDAHPNRTPTRYGGPYGSGNGWKVHRRSQYKHNGWHDCHPNYNKFDQ
jgi:hypothetical protein